MRTRATVWLCHCDEHIHARGMARLSMAGGREGSGAGGAGRNAVQGARYDIYDMTAKKYALDEINDGCQDLMDGKNIRGVVVHQH
jgi:Zn-dependent alcohol dehydrogenase